MSAAKPMLPNGSVAEVIAIQWTDAAQLHLWNDPVTGLASVGPKVWTVGILIKKPTSVDPFWRLVQGLAADGDVCEVAIIPAAWVFQVLTATSWKKFKK